MKWQTIACLLLLWGLGGCAKNYPMAPAVTPGPGSKTTTATAVTAAATTFAYGSDVSWVTQMEASGYAFFLGHLRHVALPYRFHLVQLQYPMSGQYERYGYPLWHTGHAL